MQPILIAFSIALVGVMGTVLLFSVAMRHREDEEEVSAPTRAPTSTGQFFLDEAADPHPGSDLSSDALRVRVERHVRLEQKAAEGFLRSPSAESLQTRSASQLKS